MSQLSILSENIQIRKQGEKRNSSHNKSKPTANLAKKSKIHQSYKKDSPLPPSSNEHHESPQQHEEIVTAINNNILSPPPNTNDFLGGKTSSLFHEFS